MIYCDIDFNGKDVVAILSKIKIIIFILRDGFGEKILETVLVSIRSYYPQISS